MSTVTSRATRLALAIAALTLSACAGPVPTAPQAQFDFTSCKTRVGYPEAPRRLVGKELDIASAGYAGKPGWSVESRAASAASRIETASCVCGTASADAALAEISDRMHGDAEGAAITRTVGGIGRVFEFPDQPLRDGVVQRLRLLQLDRAPSCFMILDVRYVGEAPVASVTERFQPAGGP